LALAQPCTCSHTVSVTFHAWPHPPPRRLLRRTLLIAGQLVGWACVVTSPVAVHCVWQPRQSAALGTCAELLESQQASYKGWERQAVKVYVTKVVKNLEGRDMQLKEPCQ
jgi:hypothetical protein